jgi:hypothetical protein
MDFTSFIIGIIGKIIDFAIKRGKERKDEKYQEEVIDAIRNLVDLDDDSFSKGIHDYIQSKYLLLTEQESYNEFEIEKDSEIRKIRKAALKDFSLFERSLNNYAKQPAMLIKITNLKAKSQRFGEIVKKIENFNFVEFEEWLYKNKLIILSAHPNIVLDG